MRYKMKKKFSTKWKSSKQPRKQRKYQVNAPFHIRTKFFSAALSKELRKKNKKRSLPIRVGDKVIVVRGQFKKKEGKIVRVNRKRVRVYIDSIQLQKKDGSKTFYPVHPSNLIIRELNLEDKERIKSLREKNATSEKNTSA